MKKKISYISLFAMILGLICITCFSIHKRYYSNSSAKILKIGHGLDSTHPIHLSLLHFKETIEKLSDSKMSVDIYPSGTLGGEIQAIEQLKNGSLDMTVASSAALGTFVEEIKTLTLPYIFDSSEHFWKVLDSQLGSEFLSYLNNGGIVGLCYFDSGARSFYTTKKQIITPDDLKGLKIRVMNSKTDMQLMSILGASPTPISLGEIYTALSQGVVDGAENNPPTFYTTAHCEVAKYYSLDEHTRIPDLLIIGNLSWANLSAQEKEIYKEAAKECSLYQRKLWGKMSDETIENLKDKGVKIINIDKNKFKEKATQIYKTYDGTSIGNLLEKILKL